LTWWTVTLMAWWIFLGVLAVGMAGWRWASPADRALARAIRRSVHAWSLRHQIYRMAHLQWEDRWFAIEGYVGWIIQTYRSDDGLQAQAVPYPMQGSLAVLWPLWGELLYQERDAYRAGRVLDRALWRAFVRQFGFVDVPEGDWDPAQWLDQLRRSILSGELEIEGRQ
jgi:hypothetical protein